MKVVYILSAEGERVVVTVELGRPAPGGPGRRRTVTYRLEHDPESGAFYIRLRDGEYHETIPLEGPGFGAGVDVDAEGNVLGFDEDLFLVVGEDGRSLYYSGDDMISHIKQNARALPHKIPKKYF